MRTREVGTGLGHSSEAFAQLGVDVTSTDRGTEGAGEPRRMD